MSLFSQMLKETSTICFKDYKVQAKIGAGGYSEIFAAESLKTDSSVIIKAPFQSKNSGVKLLKEADLMHKIQSVAGVPHIFETIVNEKCECIILQRLGQSMESLTKEHMNFSLKSVIMIATQIIAILKGIHSKGYIHRDIKPSNILVSGNCSSQIYLIDYGLSKSYLNTKGVHKLFNVKKNSFKGTLTFASRNTHFGYSNSRRDDFESLGYTLVYLYKGGLPWSSWKKTNFDVRTLGKFKNQCHQKELFEGLPIEFKQFFDYVENLKFEEVPNYEFMTELFRNMATRYGFDMKNAKCEWIEENLSENHTTDSARSSEEKQVKLETEEKEDQLEQGVIDESSQNSYNNVKTNLLALQMKPMKFGKFGLNNENSKTKELKQLKNNFQKFVLQK